MTITTICAVLFACIATVGFFVKRAEALPDRIISALVFEKCYLIGYPRTFCGSRSYIETIPEYDHPEGDEEHPVAMINRHVSRTVLVYTSCDDCPTSS